MIAIDKNIKMPTSGDGRRKYPWSDMEIGDSFVFTGVHGYETARTASKRFAPKKFSARTEGDHFRIWRVE